MLDTLEYPQSQMTLLEGSDHIHKVSGSDREIVDALMQFTEFDFASLVVNIYDLWNFGRTKAIREFLEKKEDRADLVQFAIMFENEMSYILKNLLASYERPTRTEQSKLQAIGISFLSDVLEASVRVRLKIPDNEPIPLETTVVIQNSIAEALYITATFPNLHRTTRPLQQQLISPQDLDI